MRNTCYSQNILTPSAYSPHNFPILSVNDKLFSQIEQGLPLFQINTLTVGIEKEILVKLFSVRRVTLDGILNLVVSKERKNALEKEAFLIFKHICFFGYDSLIHHALVCTYP